MTRFLGALLVLVLFFTGTAQAFFSPKGPVDRKAGHRTELTDQVVSPGLRQSRFVGRITGRIAFRIINGFLSNEPDFRSSLVQAVFLLGVFDMMSTDGEFPVNSTPE